MSLEAAFMVPHPPLIVKEVGKGEEEKLKDTIKSYEQVADEIAKINPETIIISSPHAMYHATTFYLDYNHELIGSFANFNASEVKFKEEVDEELINTIEEISLSKSFPCHKKNETELDHGSMVPLYFIRKKQPKSKIVILGLSASPLIENYKMGMIIKEAIDKLNRKVVYVASGDLSHKLQEYGPYGLSKEGPIYDERIMEVCSNKEFDKLLEFDEEFLDKAAECGHRSFTIMAGTLDGLDVDAKKLSHEDITGVGYGICTFYPKGTNPNRKFYDKYVNNYKEKNKSNDELVNLAKDTIYNYIVNKKIIDIPENTSDYLLNNKSGVFVSIHKFGNLRGCIGTFLPTKDNIALEIINNAISASTKDYRFNPITKDELDFLNINVDVLTTPEYIESKEQLDPKKYGVIVSSGYKRGLLLPDLEGIDDIDEQIAIAKQKAGIDEFEKIELQRFEVVRHK